LEVPAARVSFREDDRRRVADMVAESLGSGSLTLGPLTARFEEAFAARQGAAHGVAVSSGTAALEIILRSLRVEGREVIVPANTFYATAGAVIRAGAVPVFADVSPATFALSADSVTGALGPDTAAVILVHIGGIITDEVDAIRELCYERGIPLVEDAAHAHGSSLRGRSAGTFGEAGAFSFYPTKVVTTGEGGMILTGDERILDEARVYRDQGKAAFLGGEHIRPGYSWRMSEVNAAVGLVHLERLDEAIAVRSAAARRYDTALGERAGVRALAPPPGGITNYYKYVVLLPTTVDRSQLKKRMQVEHEVTLSGEVYALPLHQQPVLSRYARGPLPVAEDVCARHVCLPIHSDMTAEEADHVARSLIVTLRDLAGRGS
jgi:dTDP-4-amino-4,6-dideoxygalactose transaminase